MGFKLVLYGTVAILVQSISSQCIGNLNTGPMRQFSNGPFGPNPAGFPGPLSQNPAGFNGGCGPLGPAGIPGYTASSGGSFPVTSASPLPPSGVSVLAENLAIEGPLVVGGQLPFLGTVRLEGTLPGVGAGSVSYGCGDGTLGIFSENAAGIPGPYGLAGAIGSAFDSAAVGHLSPGAASYGLTAGTGISPYGLAGSPINSNVGTGLYNGPGSPVNPAGITGAYGLNGPIGGVGSPYGFAGKPFNPGAGIAGPYGLGGPAVGPTGSGFGPGFGGLNGLRN